MELLETQDPEKKKLIETSDRYRQNVDRELKEISDRSETVLKNALIIGGVLAATYFVVNQYADSKKKKKKVKKISQEITGEDHVEDKPTSLLSGVGNHLMNMATVFLFDLAKEKLSDYLKNRNEDTPVATGKK